MARTANYYKQNRDQIRAKENADPKRKMYQRSYNTVNADAKREYARQRYQTQPERVRAIKKSWRQRHPDRVAADSRNRLARKAAAEGKHSAKDIRHQYTAQKGRCYWCDCAVGDKYHVDHVIPLAKGGTNDPSNLVIACPTCNMSKNDKMPWEWNGNKKGRLF